MSTGIDKIDNSNNSQVGLLELKKQYPQIDFDIFLAFHNSGKSSRYIAEKLKLSQTMTYKIQRRLREYYGFIQEYDKEVINDLKYIHHLTNGVNIRYLEHIYHLTNSEYKQLKLDNLRSLGHSASITGNIVHGQIRDLQGKSTHNQGFAFLVRQSHKKTGNEETTTTTECIVKPNNSSS
jgi:hypothetical protein